MLSERARSAVSRMMVIGCFWKIFPYGWDPVKYRLTKATPRHYFLYKVHELCVLFTFSFMFSRMIQTLKEEVPSRIRIMNIIWVMAYGLVLACNYQFDRKRREIMCFANSMFMAREKYRKEMLKKLNKNPNGYVSDTVDWVSMLVLVSSVLLITNPPAHATVLISTPCAPQYISSLVYDCKTAGDIPAHWYETIPFVFLENLIISDMMFIWTFNWYIVFLGMNLITRKLKKSDPGNKYDMIGSKYESATVEYREAQLMVVLINDAFFFYLQWFPSILFTIAGMLLFATIRYTDIDFHSYIVFPFCGLRCLFEASTALQAAGIVNQTSSDYLKEWKRKINSIKDEEDQKYNSKFHRSCGLLHCSAGSMYTFENSIVLVSLNNTSQLTFNMLVTYKK